MGLQDLKDGRGGVAGVLGGVFAGMSGDPETDGAEGLLTLVVGSRKSYGKRAEYWMPRSLNSAMISDATMSQTGFRSVSKTPLAVLWAILKNRTPLGGTGKGFAA